MPYNTIYFLVFIMNTICTTKPCLDNLDTLFDIHEPSVHAASYYSIYFFSEDILRQASPLLFFIYLLRYYKKLVRERHQRRGSTNTAVVLLGTVNRPVAAWYADCLSKASDDFTCTGCNSSPIEARAGMSIDTS